jgi:ribosomal protein S6
MDFAFVKTKKLDLTGVSIFSYYEIKLIQLNHYVFKNMSVRKKYEIMILLTEEFNQSELKRWVVYFTKKLRRFSVCEISVISRGKRQLCYSIKKQMKGNYIQLNFSSMPKYLKNFSKLLNLDSNVLRFLVVNKQLQ